MNNCTQLWREARFPVKMYKTPQLRSTWKLRCRKKCALLCGAKHISKSKCTKHFSFGPLLEVAMSKKCTSLWREAHLQAKKNTTFGALLEVEKWKKCTPLWWEAHVQVKMYKTPQLRSTLKSCDVEKVHPVVARSTFRSQHVKTTRGSDHFWTFRWRKGLCTLSKDVKSEQNVKVL